MSEERTPVALLVSRLIVSVILILACFALGMFLGEQVTGLSDRFDFLRKGVPALGLGLLLGIARSSLLALNNVMNFARAEVDALNLQVAQARASAVSQAIAAEAGAASGFAVEVQTWGSVAEMAAAQAFNDSVGEYSTDLGFLNRRAEIHLENPGGCRVVAAGD